MLDEQAPALLAQVTERPIGEKDGVEWPGHINVGGGFFEGHYPGNKFECVTGTNGSEVALKVNALFESYQGNLVSGCWPVSETCVYVLFSRTMSREEIEGLQKFSEGIKAKINKEREAKAAIEAEEAKRQEDAAKETLRLAAIGKKCEDNHKKEK